MAERYFQRALAENFDDGNFPRVPIFVSARELRGSSIETAVQRIQPAAPELPRVVVVDGLDEIPEAEASRLVQEAQALALADGSARFLLTSRPRGLLRDDHSGVLVVRLPNLDDSEALELVERIAGLRVYPVDVLEWPTALTEAIRRPFFSVLMGSHLHATNRDYLTSPWQLLEEMVRRAVSQGGPSSSEEYELLVDLATRVLEFGEAIDEREVGDYRARSLITGSRFVSHERSRLDFQLPALTRWFAAQGLIRGTTSAAWLIDSRERLDRWLDAIQIALLGASESAGRELLETLAQEDIGFVGLILEGLAEWESAEELPLSVADEVRAGTEFRHAIVALGSGLGEVRRFIRPFDEYGEVRDLAFAVDDGRVTYGWFPENDPSRPGTSRFSDADTGRPASFAMLRCEDQPFWAWRTAFAVLRQDLDETLASGRLPVVSELEPEREWRIERAISEEWSTAPSIRRGLKELRSLLAHQPPLEDVGLDLDHPIARTGLESRERAWRARVRRGEEHFRSPWATKEASEIDAYRDPEILAEATQRIFESALRAYAEHVETTFRALAPRLGLAALLPVVIRMRLIHRPHDPTQPLRTNALSWHWEPVPSQEDSSVDVEIVGPGEGPSIQDYEDEYQRIMRRARELRGNGVPPTAVSFMTQVAINPLVGSPATHLTYRWLREDLSYLGWVDRFGSDPFEFD